MHEMTKRMLIMLISVGTLFGLIFAFQGFKFRMIKKFMAGNAAPVVAVSAIKAQFHPWQPKTKAVANLRAIHGVDVTPEIAGLVRTINFKPGAYVKKGDILVKLNDETEVAQLNALQASLALAQTTYTRDKAQFDAQAISKQVLDNDAANLKNFQAQVQQQQSIVAKKTIVAPFAGRLGICAINIGQYINPGDKIVTLQSFDPIYADFYVPQQSLVKIKLGQVTLVTTDSYPNKIFKGKITTIDPKVDPATRNVQVEATIANPKEELVPGMFGVVEVYAGKQEKYLTLPQTALSFNPYGEIAYLIKENGKDKEDKPILIAQQTFVTVGDSRGDQIAILKGLKENDLVVTSGQIKLKNGSVVTINNSIVPENHAAPMAPNE